MPALNDTRTRLVFCGLLSLGVLGIALRAEAYDFSATGLVDHPVSAPLEGRSPTAWRHGLGKWGESVGEQTLRLRGYNEVFEIKNGSNNGIDRIAVKRTPNGRLLDFRVVEIKTSHSSLPKLNRTRTGVQMDRDYLAAKFKAMRNSGNPEVRRLATELSRFRRSSGRPLSSFGEVLHVKPTSTTVVGYATDGRTVKYKYSLERTLRKLQTRGSSAATRSWASRQLADLKRIRAADMRSWSGSASVRAPLPWPWNRNRLPGRFYPTKINVSARQAGRSLTAVARREAAATLRTGSSQIARSTLLNTTARRAGPLLAVAFTAYDVYNTERSFALDRISVRERYASHARTGGGFAGGIAGGTAGAAGGAAVGAFTGPFAPICVPLFGIIGGIGGSVGGYIGGSAAADYGVRSWYRLEDQETQREFRQRFVSMRFPLD